METPYEKQIKNGVESSPNSDSYVEPQQIQKSRKKQKKSGSRKIVDSDKVSMEKGGECPHDSETKARKKKKKNKEC